MTALVALLGKLVTQEGHILIPGVYDGIKPADADELYVFSYPQRISLIILWSG